ncbi:MAG: flagellar basal body rod protein FlgB [Nitrospirae bacterium]|nr:MAG: flagellar basal body rod protein FlgB [Nitrospirota bacterium]
MITSPWDQGTRLFEVALDIRSAAHELIAANIANEETPGYKARHIPFRETLDAVLSGHHPLEPHNTHPRHIPVADEQGRLFHFATREIAGSGPDGNTVSLEKEMAMMAENAVLYLAVNQFLAGRFDGWRAAIDEGRRG